jgi:metallophosphoesterase superfamily enzyme
MAKAMLVMPALNPIENGDPLGASDTSAIATRRNWRERTLDEHLS